MSKPEIIDRIRKLNPSAQTEFLASFSDEDLLAYLRQLQELQRDHVRRQDRELVLVAQA
ncbi:MAG TPA: hypothetical protein PKG54_07160 [Phycisphaerae bacterium]|jgi:hypothetical protein|nr:hypothetical protein [Phycisphaerae bacterium]HOB74288.1 hypothetical protein [Phycisphaerae bacterium]HOJ53121.1 hypothetical protein [Phycisphaerae bacterium]HOL24858.1 hypothetical protein [Phycisphaerae bacterium]HPP19394.1 hypothetical protein [Phycisphaerae bacterium]